MWAVQAAAAWLLVVVVAAAVSAAADGVLQTYIFYYSEAKPSCIRIEHHCLHWFFL